MPKAPPVGELEFLHTTQNHRDYRSRLLRLGQTVAEAEIREFANFVGLRWYKLATFHLREATRSLGNRSRRSAYSRAYYAAYNASKAVRYIASGFVSLKADDHQKAPDLPGDFPQAASWGPKLMTLYEQRLRADYDFWRGTPAKFTLTPKACVGMARAFVRECRGYLRDRHGLKP